MTKLLFHRYLERMTKQKPQGHQGIKELSVLMPLWLKYFASTLLLLLLTFPKTRPETSLAIDPQIHWAFNYLWINDFSQTQNIIFPHGALAFLNYPLAMGDNLSWAVLFQAIFRSIFILTFLLLGNLIQAKKWFVTLLLLFFMLEFMELDFIFMGIVANAIFLFFFTKNKYWYALAVTVFTLGFYIKISIGITSLTILFSSIFLYFLNGKFSFFQKKKFQVVGIQLLMIPMSLAIGWFLMYQNFDVFGKYLFGVLELVSGNSDSASLYPDNNWWYLGFCALAFFAIPILDFGKNGFQGSKHTWVVYVLLGLSVFAIWKHSMAREDPWHIVKLFAWLLIFFSYLFVLQKKIKWSSLILSGACLFFFHANIKSTVGMFVEELDRNGYKNFTEAFFCQEEFFQQNISKSLKNIEPCKLTKTDRALIGEKTVDCYPWNYCFIEANNLNWQPRPIIQSYAAYTPWLDKQNSQHYSSKNAPQFLIWEMDMLKRDIWEAELTSIDNHYLLNDEPQTIIQILSNYRLINKASNYLLFEKRKNPILERSEIINSESLNWNEWIEVPFYGDGILQVQFHYEENFLKWLKAKAYKDEPVFMEYQLTNGEMRKHRFTSLNAEQGLWVNPFIIQPSHNLTNAITSKVRFSTPNDFLVKKETQIKWTFFLIEKKNAKENYLQAFNLFGKNIPHSEKMIFEKTDAIPNEQILQPKEYSTSYEIPLSELMVDSTSTISIASSVQAKMSYHAQGLLVIVVEQNGKVIFWDGKRIEDFMTIYQKWEVALSKKTIPKEATRNAIVKVYVWNTGKEIFSIKNLEAKLLISLDE